MTIAERAIVGVTEETRGQLDKAIGELLKAGWNTGKIADAMSKPDAFGLEGVDREYALNRANNLCRAANAMQAKIYREALAEVRAALPHHFRKYIR